MTTLTFQPMTFAQWQGAVSDGSAGAASPFLAEEVYTAAISAAQDRNIDPRVLLAWTRGENNQATNISAGLLAAHNGAGIKYVGQPRATSGALAKPPVLAPASEGSAPYCVFATWGDFWWTLAVNIITILPDAWAAGDLGKIASEYTSGDPNAGAGSDKVTFYQQYAAKYPPGGAPMTGVYGEDIVAALVPHIGESNSNGALDPWNMALYPNHPWAGFCEAATEGAQYTAGLIDVVHRPSAADKLDAVTAQGLLQTSWPPEDGACCLWGRSFDPNGHTTVYSAAKGMWISTLYNPSRLDYYMNDAWKAAMSGWYRAPGVVAATRTVPVAPPVTPLTPFFVDGCAIPLRDLFWARWDALNTMGKKMDRPGQINPDGLALPTLGYPVEPDTTLPSGRRVQKFERAYLAYDRGAAPFDVVVMLLTEQPK